MGTHPIFESDFDCLTEKMPNFNDEDRDSSTDDDWDKSSSDEEEKKPVQAAPKKKKGLAAKIAEREAKEAEARKKARELAEMSPAQKKAMIEKEEEANAEDFLGEDDENINQNTSSKSTPRPFARALLCCPNHHFMRIL